MKKIACIIQGNIRAGFIDVLQEMNRKFDLVILSTWKDERDKLPVGNYEVLLNEKPPNPGMTNRNLQRLSAAAGIEYAKAKGCTHILKWRTDMLPTNMKITDLISWSEYNVPPGMPSRIVMSAWRNLTVEQDWFSSFPDLFAFGAIDAVKMLWSKDGLDFSKPFNVPSDMIKEYELNISNNLLLNKDKKDVTNAYDAHVELYAYFRSRLQHRLNKTLNHKDIAKDYLYLIDHHRLRICWFSGRKWRRFRSIGQAYNIPWWTEKDWQTGYAAVAQMGYANVDRGWRKSLISWIKVEKEMLCQFLYYCKKK